MAFDMHFFACLTIFPDQAWSAVFGQPGATSSASCDEGAGLRFAFTYFGNFQQSDLLCLEKLRSGVDIKIGPY